MIGAVISLSAAMLFASVAPGTRVDDAVTKGPSASAASDVHYSVHETVFELLLDDAQARAVIDRHFPGMTASEQMRHAGGFTLSELHQFLPTVITAEKLAAIQADFDKF